MPKIGDRYIIEIAEEYYPDLVDGTVKSECYPPELYRVRGILNTFFEGKTFDKLEKYDPDNEDAYQRGLHDAWEAARKIAANPKEGGLKMGELSDIFGTPLATSIMGEITAEQAIEKLAAYETKKKAEEEEIKVGDEVSSNMIKRGVVTRVNNCEGGAWCYVVESGGNSCSMPIRNLRKTGKHFPQVAELLAAMEEDGDTNEEP